MRFTLLTFLLVLLCAAGAPAQKKGCSLQLEVVENQADASGEKVKIEDAEAVVFAFKGMDRKKSKSSDKMPYFDVLEEGNYSVTVSKKGYKSTVKRIRHDCVAQVTAHQVWMWKGSPKEKVHYMDADYEASIFDKLMIVDLALEMPKPDYPKPAIAVRASGAVAVRVTIDEQGEVVSAERISGHPLLAPSAVETAKKTKFAPSWTKDKQVKITGVIVYNFSPR